MNKDMEIALKCIDRLEAYERRRHIHGGFRLGIGLASLFIFLFIGFFHFVYFGLMIAK